MVRAHKPNSFFHAPQTENMQSKQGYSPIPVPRSFIVMLSLIHFSTYLGVGVVLHLVDHSVPFWIVMLSAYIASVLALSTHWAGHRRWSGWWYTAHMGHHLADYPPSRFLSPGYQLAKEDNSKAYYFTFLLTPILTCTLTNNLTFKMIIITSLPGILLLLLVDYLHQGIHTNGFHLEKYNWFLWLRSLHYYHHKGDMKRNYAITDFLLDFWVLGFQYGP